MNEKDFVVIRVPRRVADEARRRGLDVESLAIDSVIEKLELDPREEAVIHVELAERFLNEARERIDRGDPVQASEKLYKVAEECIKALAIALDLGGEGSEDEGDVDPEVTGLRSS